MQRLHEQDLTGHLLAKQGYEHISLPATAERYERWRFPISGRVVERQPGESWANDYLSELTMFPAGQHDDRVDSTTQFLNHVRKPRQSGIWEYYREAATAKPPETATATA